MVPGVSASCRLDFGVKYSVYHKLGMATNQIDGLETDHNGYSETGEAYERDPQPQKVSIYYVMDGFDDFYMTPSAHWAFHLEIVCSKRCKA